MPSDISIAEIDVPDSVHISSVAMPDLPAGWYHYPAPMALQQYGLKWFKSGKSLILRVPSVQVKHEYNFLINPLHPDMRDVKILNVDIFLYDERLTAR